MDTTPLCPSCGKPLAASAPKGLCQECLLKAAFPTSTETGGASPPFNPPPVADLSERFPQLEIIQLIGSGGMGAVYKARQKELDRIVALKILPPGVGSDNAFANRFAREAKALARLNHSNVVTLYEFGRADGLFFFLMEFVDGVNLRQLLNAGRLSAREALVMVPQICDALQYAHDQGIVHRDIKPENILLDRKGRVKVADFGLARLMGREPEGSASGSDGIPASATLTEAGKIMGTPQYMAPEQTEKPTEVDHRADIYSLGVVLYQMLTGELPGKRIEPPSKKVQLDVRLDDVVLRALERQPERRYQQASQIKTDVETIASGISASEPRDSKTRPEESRYTPGGWRTWVPFQSPEVKAICAHMTDAEKREDLKLQVVGALGTLLASLALVFLHDLMPEGHRPSTELFFLLVIGLLLFVWIAFDIGKYKSFLCSTAWAREQGFTPDQIKLLSIGNRGVWIGIGVLSVLLLAIAIPNLVKAPRTPLQTRRAVAAGVSTWRSFGPVIERVMLDNTATNLCLIDLDRNEVFDRALEKVYARDQSGRESGLAWRRQQGIDAVAWNRKSWETQGLVGWDMRVVPVGPHSWDITPAVLAGLLSSVQPSPETKLRGDHALPATFLFQTREGGAGILQVTDFTDDPGGVKFRYKLAQSVASLATEPPAIPEAALVEPPRLRFLAWQDEWRHDAVKKDLPGRAWHPDGSAVTDKTELRLLRAVSPAQHGPGKRNPRFLHLWFSHPLFDHHNSCEVALLDGAGRLIPAEDIRRSGSLRRAADAEVGNVGWITQTMSVGEGHEIPRTATIRLHYTLGPLERQRQIVPDQFNIRTGFSLEGNSEVNGIGQDASGTTFVAIAIDAQQSAGRSFGMIAVTRDGRQLESGPAYSTDLSRPGATVGIARFEFAVPLADVAHFRVGTRPVRTMEWKDVALYRELPPPRPIGTNACVARWPRGRTEFLS